MIELVEKRQENSKSFKLDSGRDQIRLSIGAIHYKDDYAPGEQWKDIDLTWEGNRITKAPYELTLEGRKITIRDKKSGEVSTIEILDIGGKDILDKAWETSEGLARAPGITTLENVALDTDLEIVAQSSRVRFARILKSDKAPPEARFKVTGKIPFRVRASDDEGTLPVESSLAGDILTERLKADRAVKYPARIDPTWQVGADTDDCTRFLNPTYWNLSENTQMVGVADAANTRRGGGMRFTNITIPQGSTIEDGTHLTFICSLAWPNLGVDSRISAEDIDDPATFADSSIAFDARWAARTAARVDWDNIPAWDLDGEYDSPEIKTVIQEIVDRGGWASGQDIVIFWDDFDDRSDHLAERLRFAYSHENDPAKAPELVIEYTPLVAKKHTFRLHPRPGPRMEFHPDLKLG